MKKLVTIISAVAWLTSNLIFAQSNTEYSNDPHDLEGMATYGNENSWTPHGEVWTPKGDLKVLVIFAGFESDPDLDLWQNPSAEIWPNNLGNLKDVGPPTYENPETGEMSDFLFSNPDDKYYRCLLLITAISFKLQYNTLFNERTSKIYCSSKHSFHFSNRHSAKRIWYCNQNHLYDEKLS